LEYPGFLHFCAKMASAKCQPMVLLNNGTAMPALGLGTFLSDPGVVGKAVVQALKAGYRHIDCAAMYGNEKEIGAALKNLFADKTAGIKRSDVWITSKIVPSDMRPDNVKKALTKTLHDLQLKYLDLYLVHQPVPLELDPTYDGSHRIIGKYKPLRGVGFGIQDIWRAMEGCQAAGLTKAIGVSNFHSQLLNDLLCYAHVRPAVNQVERHPYFSQSKLVEFCSKWGIAVTGYAPLGAPGLYGAGATDKLLDNVTVTGIASKYKKSAAQVLIRWAIDTGCITIPKSSNPKRIAENIGVFDFELTAEDLAALNTLNKGPRGRLFHQDWHGVPSFEFNSRL